MKAAIRAGQTWKDAVGAHEGAAAQADVGPDGAKNAKAPSQRRTKAQRRTGRVWSQGLTIILKGFHPDLSDLG